MSFIPAYEMESSGPSIPRFAMRTNGAPPHFTFIEPKLDNCIPPTTAADTKSDYDYEEPSYYDIFRDRLEELKLGWPLTTKDEDEITKKTKGDPEIQIIKIAYTKGNVDQKLEMSTLADKIRYIL